MFTQSMIFDSYSTLVVYQLSLLNNITILNRIVLIVFIFIIIIKLTTNYEHRNMVMIIFFDLKNITIFFH